MKRLKQLKPWQRWGISFGTIYFLLFILVSFLLKFAGITGESRIIILPMIAPSLLFGQIFLESFMYSERNVLLYLYHLLFNVIFYSGIGALLGFIVGKLQNKIKHTPFQSILLLHVLVGLGSNFTTNNTGWAYNIPTHQAITQRAIQLSSIEASLQSRLSLSLPGATFYDLNAGIAYPGTTWILKGSMFEDQPPEDLLPSFSIRARNHFHNPITDQGLSDGLDFFAKSAKTWAISDSGNNWSWSRARQYLNDALTKTKKEERDDNFAKLFRSLGQVVHLIQDMAVPAHVRNDNHAIMSTLSGYSSFFDFYESIVERTVDPLTFSAAPFSVGPGFPLAAFWDSEIYRDLPTLQSNLTGLSEYTSYNFFSEDTIFTEYFPNTDKHYFPHPRKEFTNAVLKEELAEDGTTDQVYYVQGYDTVRLATYSYFHRPLADLGLLGYVLSGWDYHLDESVVRNNANILIPKAISYSAVLLNYFFRGQLEITLAQGGLKVKNTNTEPMIESGITIYYDDTSLTRHFLAAYGFDSLNPGDETPLISFTRPSDNIKGRYIVVFNGQLGAEEGVVIGAMSPPPLYYVSKRSGVYKIFRMDADGSNQAVVYDNTNPNLTIGKLAPSPDGKTLAFTVEGPRIYLLDLTSHALSELTQGDWPDWSPDGKKIVFQRDVTPDYAYLNGIKRWSNTEIFVRTIASGSEVQLTEIPPIEENSGSFKGHPAFSPDGRTIAYARWPADQADCNNPTSFMIYLMDTSGNSNRPLTCDEEKAWLDEAPSWSPDGHEIAFLRRWVNEYDQLYKVSVDSKAITKLTESDGTAYAEFTPAWSSDGKVIAIGSNRDGNFDIWRVSPTGGGYLSNLTVTNPDIDGYPAYVK